MRDPGNKVGVANLPNRLTPPPLPPQSSISLHFHPEFDCQSPYPASDIVRLMLSNLAELARGRRDNRDDLRLLSGAGQKTTVGEMVQNSQSLYSLTLNALIDIHEYIYSHSTTEFTFKKYIYSHLPVYFLFAIIFAHIYEMSSFTFNELYPFTFTIEIFIQHFLRITFAHRSV